MVPVAWLRAEFSGLLDLLLPPYCPLCRQQPVAESGVFCAACRAGIHPVSAPSCPCCALPYLTLDGSDHLCGDCVREPPPFLWTVAGGVYEETLRDAIHRFKYRQALTLERPLVRLLADALAGPLPVFAPDLLLPVPLHRSRLRERGYNQSLLLARALGRHFGIAVAPRLLLRTRPTPPQQGLSATERHDNLAGAFALRRPLDGARILLIDDVMTTGATARRCAQALRAGGASAVAVAVLGRARRYH